MKINCNFRTITINEEYTITIGCGEERGCILEQLLADAKDVGINEEWINGVLLVK